jgi:hypothetical protein
MQVAIVTALHQRPELTRVVQDYYANYYDDCKLIAVKSPGDEQPVNNAWHHVEHKNNPVSQKFNRAFLAAKDFNPDIVVLIGSDDLVAYSLIDYYKRHYPADASYMLGLRDLYYHDAATKQTIHYSGLPDTYKGMPIGCGRAFSKTILDKLDWLPYGKLTVDRGMDTNSKDILQRKGITFKSVTMADAECQAVDIKTSVCLHPFDRIASKPLVYGESTPVPYDTIKQFHPYIECVSTSS